MEFYPSERKQTPCLNWSRRIKTCVSQKKFKEAIEIYARDQNNRSFVIGVVPLVLKACACLCMLNLGKAVHAESTKAGMEFDIMVGTSLVDMYSKCGDLLGSRKLFDLMPERNVITWNAMIGGYMRNGATSSARLLFEEMGTRTSVTWIEMIDGYAKSGDLVTARWFFDRMPEVMKTVVAWTVMVEGYASNGEMEAASGVFESMPRRNFYVWSSMISGYFKKGDVKEARAIFDNMPLRNLVNWNSLICGYTKSGLSEEALNAYRRMQVEGFEPDEVTIACILSACAQLGILDVGREMHEMINQKGIQLNQFILNGLVDMYAKCGDLSSARLVFEAMSHKNVATWNALISGFAIHGQCREAIEHFQRMESSGEKPNDVTLLSVLSACAHGGLVDEGLATFSKLEKYEVPANVKHYGCLVDLLGRAGRLQEAYNLIKTMPFEPNDTILGALLGACQIHSESEIAELVLKEVFSGSGSSDNAHYVLLSNIYAASERWEQAEAMRLLPTEKGFNRVPGSSSVCS